MNWKLEECVKTINDLLWCQTYNELSARLQVLSDQGISMGDDFVQTDDRKRELESIKKQFQNSEGPSVILTGWYGAGKSAVLRRIVKALSSGELTYGAFQVDPVEIELNVQNTLNLFLSRVLEYLESKAGREWSVQVYKNKQHLLDLPELNGEAMDSIRVALQKLPIARMESVVEFLEEMFKDYKRQSDNKRVICLVFDELENISLAAQVPEASDYNKLVRLLQIFLDKSVREYIDKPINRRSPFLLVIFSVLEVAELERGQWLRQDTADRCASVHRDINLSASTAEFLMKSMLRIYFTGVLGAACKDTTDGRLLAWKEQVESANQSSDSFYTYPIMPDVHAFISQRILVAAGHKGIIRRFRAYQKTILELLDRWSGDTPIDVRFVIAQSETLRYALADYAPEGVELRNIIDSTSIRDLIGNRFRELKFDQIYEISRLTEAAITRRVTPVVSVNWKTIEALTGEASNLSEAAFQETLRKMSRTSVKGWAITGDALAFEIPSIIEQLGTPAKRISEEDIIVELLQKTSPQRTSNTLPKLLFDSIQGNDPTLDKNRTFVHDNQTIHVATSKEALIEEYIITFDGQPQYISNMQGQTIGLKPGILFKQRANAKADDLPFEVQVFLPKPLDKQQTKYGEAIEKAFRAGDLRERVFQPLINSLIKTEKLTPYLAFQEAVKTILLLEHMGPADRVAFKKYQINRPLLTLFLSPMELSNSDELEWICYKLTFHAAHQLDPFRRLIKILSWVEEQGSTSLIYQNSADVQAPIKGKIFEQAHLPAEPENWKRELEDEWGQEWFIRDFRLPAYPEWPPAVREKYEELNNTLIGKTVRFYDVAKYMFGQGPVNRLSPTAIASLHLFLKIGHVYPLGWKLSDDVHESYASMTITPRDVLRESKLRIARSEVAKLRTESVICCCAASEEDSQTLAESVGLILDKEQELGDDASIEKIEVILSELSKFTKPTLPVISKWASQQDVQRQRLAQIYPKLGEYLSQLDLVCSSPSIFSLFVSHAAEPMFTAIISDTEYEFNVWRLDRLYNNWSKQAQDDRPNDRLLKRVEDWYIQGLSSLGSWANLKSEEFINKFQKKVVDIRRNHVAEDLAGIKEWVRTYINSIIFENAKPTFDAENNEQIKSKLRVAENEARKELSDLFTEIRQAVSQADQLEADPVAALTFKIEIVQQKGRLEQIISMLEQATGQIFTSPFGQLLKSGKAELKNWAAINAKVHQTKETKIKSWLEKEDLSGYEELILSQFGNVRKAIQDLDSEWLNSGVDVLNKLKEGPPELLAILAASRLLRYLEGGNQ